MNAYLTALLTGILLVGAGSGIICFELGNNLSEQNIRTLTIRLTPFSIVGLTLAITGCLLLGILSCAGIFNTISGGGLML